MTISENLRYLSQFGVGVTLAKTINKLLRKTKYADRISNWNNDVIKNYLRKDCKNTLEKYKKKSRNGDLCLGVNEYDDMNNNVIWTMWWQGLDSAPEIVKHCVKHMYENANGHPIIIITKENINKYVELPNSLFNAVEERKIDIIKLSDVLRCILLYKYGGLWLDSTIFLTAPLDESIFKQNFYSSFLKDKTGRFITMYCMGSKKNNDLMKFVFDMHMEYFEHRHAIIHYFLCDYFMMIARDDFDSFSYLFEKTGDTNPHIEHLQKEFDKGNIPADIDLLNAYLKDTNIFKLNYKFPDKRKTVDNTGEDTMYGLILKM